MQRININNIITIILILINVGLFIFNISFKLKINNIETTEPVTISNKDLKDFKNYANLILQAKNTKQRFEVLTELETLMSEENFNNFKSSILDTLAEDIQISIKEFNLITFGYEENSNTYKYMFRVVYNNTYSDIEELLYLEKENDLITKQIFY